MKALLFSLTAWSILNLAGAATSAAQPIGNKSAGSAGKSKRAQHESPPAAAPSSKFPHQIPTRTDAELTSTVLPEGIEIIERKFMKSHQRGVEAVEQLKEALKQEDWWQVSKHYATAQWNIYIHDLPDVQALINNVLGPWLAPNKKGLDVGVLGFGWRREFGTHKIEYYDRRKEAVAAARADPELSSESIQQMLKSPKYTDKRPLCPQMRDVAGVQAEALRWTEAVDTVTQACGRLSVKDEGRLLGFLSTGVKRGIPADSVPTIRQVLEGLSERAQEKRKVTEWAAAVYSLQQNLRQVFTHTVPHLDTYEAALKRFRISTDPYLMHHEKMSEVLGRANRRDYVHLLPVIETAFNKKRRNAGEAYHFLANLLCEYYRKDGDFWQAWYWFQEARTMGKGEVEDRWMHTLEDKIRNSSAQELRLLLKAGASEFFADLLANLDQWGVSHDKD